MNPMKPAAGTMGTSAAPAASRATAAGRRSFWHEILGAFSPNRVISKAAFRFIIAFQVAVLLIVWATSTYVFLPKPMDVWRAFVDLWSHEGLGQELIVSFSLNLQAMAWATLISLGLVPKEKFDLARTLRMGEWRVVWEVIVLGRADAAFDAMRQNAAMGWMMLTMVEGISRSEGGIGALLLNQNKHFRLEAVFAIQIAILLIGLFQDYALGLAKKFLFPYADLQLEKR